MNDQKNAPWLLPLTLALSVLLWIMTMTGGRQIFVREVLGSAYDSQAEHFLHGNVEVDPGDISSEAMIDNGKVHMYFGPFPAFVRMPLNLIYPAGRGMWSRLCGFFAGIIALFSFAGLVGDALRASPLSPRMRNWIGNMCLAAFVFGTPVLYMLGNLSIFSETIMWGLAWSLAALFFACRSWNSEGRPLTWWLLGFSFCAAAALLSRVTFGAPFLFIAPALALRLWRTNQMRRLIALALPLSAGLAFYLWLSYARFGNLGGISYTNYIGAIHREFVLKHGSFDLHRVPYSFADYFRLEGPLFRSRPPFVVVDRYPLKHASYYSLPFSEAFVSIPWSSAWLAFGAAIGIVYLFHPKRSDWFQRWVALALLAECVCVLSYITLAQRYIGDLCPFLIFCLIIFLRNGGHVLLRSALIGLAVVSMVINLLATAFFLGGDGHLSMETRVFWSAIAGRGPPH
jgi:hypothetical protein